jgi:hypothetical protein
LAIRANPIGDFHNKIGHERHFALRKMWIEMKPKWAAVACLDDRFQSATLPLIINWGF